MPHWPKLLFDNREGTPLERTQALLARLGDPQNRLPPVVHVAGTNGKGSTIAFLRAMLEAAGYRVHCYTSPHLRRFNERIVLAGREIDDTQLFTVIEATRMAAGEDSFSLFEGTTAAALLAFSQVPADILLMETGVGGRFDPTNVVERPALTVITTISRDHTDILGESLMEIAWHKAGIMRGGVPCVISFQPPEAHQVLERETAQAVVCVYGQHWAVQKTSDGMRYVNGDGAVDLSAPALLGPHQYVNAGNAITAATLLQDFEVSQDAVTAGLLQAHWPGRLERILAGPRASMLPPGWELWMDGGHNMAAGHMLAAFIEESWKHKPTYIVFGTTQGKDIESLLIPLVGKVRGIYATEVVSEPKSYPAEAIAQAMQAHAPITLCRGVEDALERITAAGEPGRILVFGSLYLRVLVV